jgi:(1->4)-alpha-D-glucan 1-alpha-D-glucosylmutase
VPYLSRLGISHCYASPLLKARPGSPHGYDITNHQELNPEIGSREDFEHLVNTLHDHGMGVILDIVPNHMGAGPDNPWWMDVLENGPSSLYAGYFDIDWQPLAPDLQNKILLAILGDSYGKILDNGELKLRFMAESGRFWLDYYEHAMPINPNTYGIILSHRLDVLEARLGGNQPPLYEYQSIMAALDNLPVETGDDWPRKEIRMRERTIALSRLAALCGQVPEIRHFIEENVQDFQPRREDPTSLNRLHRLLEQQAYRLSNWRVASDEINYRRFFDVNDLVALRVEDPRVFNDTHEFIMELIEKGLVHGLRIDHPDGLFDPAAYFQQLQQESARRLTLPESRDWKLNAPNLALYVIIEKILAPFERLPEEWAIHGTTGYEFSNTVNGLFVQEDHERNFTRLYEKLLERRINFEDLVYQCKRLIMKTTLNSELGVLTAQLYRIAKKNWAFRDFTLQNLRAALMEVVACFPVYRTYVTPERISTKDREYIDWAIRLAKRRSTATDTSIFDFIRQALLLEELASLPQERITGAEVAPDAMTGREASPESSLGSQELNRRLPEWNRDAADFRHAIIRFSLKFQQYTGPVMAKGLEDTSFYRYNRLISLNDVGGEPQQFGIPAATFHQRNIDRLQRAPHTLLATSTHDTKRSEDVRARISVLSEMPAEWQKHLSLWRRLNRHHRRVLEFGQPAPSVNDEILFYQTLLGIWPSTLPDQNGLESLAQRLATYMLKAVREAKSHTSWININDEYEAALLDYIRRVLLQPSQAFFDDFLAFGKVVSRLGAFNSLSQTLLKLTCPGVPDIYQGTEFWDFSLVDPDNRRLVDYDQRRQGIDKIQAILCETDPEKFRTGLMEAFSNLPDGHFKQYIMTVVLRFRAEHPTLFMGGHYIPLELTGVHAEHGVAFVRHWEDVAVLVAVPRLCHTLGVRRNEFPCGKRIWRNTAILLPTALKGAHFESLLTRQILRPGLKDPNRIAMAEILKDLPVGFLVARRTA